MPPHHDNPPFSFQDPDAFRILRDVFSAADYTEKGILTALGVSDISSMKGDNVPLLLHRTSRGTPLDTLIRLFLIKVPCSIQVIQQAIRPMEIESWAEAGLIHVNKTSVTAAMEIIPFRNFLLAYDHPNVLNTPFKEHYVMGIGSSTLTLANLTVRSRSRRTLDLGAGCGIHGMLASSHSDRVIAADLNPRAKAFATFNSILNRITNMECVQGDLFEPVRDQKFDLVVTNPPFVVSPESRYVYRDGGTQSDHMTKKIVQQAPNFLNEGGFCQILCNWVRKTDQDWRERLQTWFAGTGCDVWVMQSETYDAAAYATKWIRHTERDNKVNDAQRFKKWIAYYEEQKIEAVSTGIITMRRSSAHKNWFWTDDTPERMLGPCGDTIVQGFRLRDFLGSMHSDEALLNERLHYAPHIRLERQSAPIDDRWVEDINRIHLTKGFAYSGAIDPFVANLVMACDGTHTLKDLLNQMAASLGSDSKDITSDFCRVVRGLLEKGYILPEP